MRGSLSIRSLRVLLAPASVCLLLAGCAQPAPTPTPDPRIDDLQDAVSRVGQTLERLEGEVERLANAPTPTPGPSLKQMDARISQAIAAIPTGTPTPVPPPSVTFEEARSLMDEAIETSVAMALAAMPGPPGTVREAHVSGGVDVSMFGEVSLRIEPGQPMAGHDVSFTLTGLDPWQPVALSFRDPTGRSAEWIAPTETRFAWIDGSPITGQWFHADEEGSLSWTRIGTLDREGTWSVVVAVDGVDYPVEYPVMDLPLPKPESAELGVELRRYRGSVSDTYTSALVPAALTIDLQSYLVWTMVVLSSEMGIARTSQIPDLYLAGSGDALDRIREEIGFDVPIEPDGFYSDVGGNPAVYIRTDYPLTSILRLLTHEYVHLALDEMSGGVRLPAWIDEGLATYAEYSLGLRSVRPDATRAQMYASIDVVKNAAASGTLFPLTSCNCSAIMSSLTVKGKCPHEGACDIDAERADKASGSQQFDGGPYDHGAGSDFDGSERAPHQAYSGGLQQGGSSRTRSRQSRSQTGQRYIGPVGDRRGGPGADPIRGSQPHAPERVAEGARGHRHRS